MTTGTSIDFTISEENGKLTITPVGDWTVRALGQIDKKLRELEPSQVQIYLDVSRLGGIDTAGAYVLDRTLRNSGELPLDMVVSGTHHNALPLLTKVRSTCDVMRPEDDQRAPVQD